MARRKDTREASCSAMPWATSLDLEDVELDLLAGQLLELTAQALGLGPTATDDDAGTGGVQVDAHAVTGALDVDLGDTGPLHAVLHEAADLDILLHEVAVTLTGLGSASGGPW